MTESPLRLVKNWQPLLHKKDIDELPKGMRGIYVLYKYRRSTDSHNVVYVGMSSSGQYGHIRRRLRAHRKSKSSLWTHCSVYEVWPNIRDSEITELEGLFRQIYKTDSRANKLNKQQGFKKLWQVPKIV